MPVPIVSVEGMRSREVRTWASGVAPEAVIRRAGMAVAGVIQRSTRTGAPVLVLAGRGHNGDDAEVAAGGVEGREVTFLRLRDAQSFGRAHAWLEGHSGREDALIVDGLFGIGLNRPLDGEWAGLVMEVNRAGVPVLAVDVPSGLNAESGEPMGTTMVATRTVTLGAVKRGLLTESATPYVGRLELAPDIGLMPCEGDGSFLWTLGRDFRGYPPRRHESAHKGTFGHVVVVAGSPGFHGAAVLAARGALRARPGLVSVVTDERCYGPVAASVSSAMVRAWGGERWDGDGITAVVMGPGLASPTLSPAWSVEAVRVWREARCAVVVDASALDWLPPGGPCAGVRVVTPHPGEAGRMLGIPAAEVQADRLGAARGLVARWPGVAVWGVLKGRHTHVAGAEGTVWVNPTGNPGLAQGGTGDVLAGYLGGLLAPPSAAEDVGLAVRYGVWRHGAVADALEDTGEAWTSEDLASSMGRVLAERRS